MKRFFLLLFAVLSSCIPENKPPVCNITLPAGGSEYSRGEEIQIHIDASDEDGVIAEVRIFIDATGVTSIQQFPYNYIFPSSQIEVGSHTIKAEAVDNDGSESEATVSFVLKSALPGVVTEEPFIVSDDSVVVIGTIVDNGGSAVTSTGFLWGKEPFDGTGSNEITATINDNAFSVTLKDLAYENYYVIAFAENEIGRSYGEQVNFTPFPPENVPPVCSIIMPSMGSQYSKGENIEILVDATDEDGTIDEVRLYIDSVGITALRNFPFNFTYPTGNLEVGLHTVKVEAVDNDGSATEASVMIVLIPALPVVETVEPGSVTTNSAVVGGTIVDNGGGLITAAGILWGNKPYDGTGFSEVSAEVIDNAFSITLDDLAHGTYYVIAFAENSIGRSYGEQVSFQTILSTDLFIDNRDGQSYQWVKIGPQIWMAENLAYLPEMRNSSNYSETDPFYYVYDYYGFKVEEAKATYNYNTYGVLYNFTAAYDACPDGWHLPASEDVQSLISFIGGQDDVEKLMDTGTEHWIYNPNGTNSTGFTALGAGWAELDPGDTFHFLNYSAAGGWWKVDSCGPTSQRAAPYTITRAPYTVDHSGQPSFNDSDCELFSSGYSIRCIKD